MRLYYSTLPTILVGLLFLFLTSCGGSSGDTSNSGDTSSGQRVIDITGQVTFSSQAGTTGVNGAQKVITSALSDVIANADVKLNMLPVPPGTPEYSAVSDSSGEFSVEGVETGRYRVEIRSTTPGTVYWNRAEIDITADGDIGTFPLDAGPHFDSISLGGEMIGAFRYGEREQTATSEVHFAPGTTVSFDVRLTDPNDRDITGRLWLYDVATEQARYEEVPALRVDDNSQSIPITITFQSNHVIVDVAGFEQRLIPHMVAGRSREDAYPSCELGSYDACDTPPVFVWENVEYFRYAFGVENGDAEGSLDGSDDAVVFLVLKNPSYTFEPAVDVPELRSLTINGVTHSNDNVDSDMEVDLDYIGGVTALDITANVKADEDFPLRYFWHVPSESGYGESRRLIEVADLPKTYSGEDTKIMIDAEYAERDADGNHIYYSQEKITATIRYDISGDALPAQCTDIAIDGETDTDNTLYTVGQTIAIQVQASDPKGLPIEVAVRREGSFEVPYEESYITGYDEATHDITWVPSSSVISYTITDEDNVDRFALLALCRNNDGFGENGADSADSTVKAGLQITN